MTSVVALQPATTADVAAAVIEAAARGTPLRIAGRGLWLDAGRPTRDAAPLSLAALTGIVAYTPGDLTLTARAGTTLGQIAEATAPHGQWLTLDPFGSADGTLGATIATASTGPLAHAFGTPRDVTLGIEAVTGDGAVIRAGGRVVKNVAGFDLTRLFTGAWGTLGVLTEVTVRLRARPAVEETWCVAVAPDGVDALCAALRAAPLAPLALELLDARAADVVGLGTSDALLVRLGGNDDAVAAQRTAIRVLGRAAPAPLDVWSTLRTAEPPGAAVVRLSTLPGRLAALWRTAGDITALGHGAWRHASVGRGIVRLVVPAHEREALDALVRAAAAQPATTVAERLPAAAWSALASPVPNAELARRVKRAFDPGALLNPGMLGIEP